MSFFSTTSSFSHRTPLPSPISRSSAIELLRDHDWLIRLDPELHEYELDASVPATSPNTKNYIVTDHMNALPRAIYDAKVTFKAEMKDVEDGIQWTIRAPLGLVQTSHWKIVGGSDGEELALVEDVKLACNRLIMGTVMAKCEENWRGIHGKFVARLQGEADKSGAK